MCDVAAWIHYSLVSVCSSQSFYSSRRYLPNHEKVRSITYFLGSRAKPCVPGALPTISAVQPNCSLVHPSNQSATVAGACPHMLHATGLRLSRLQRLIGPTSVLDIGGVDQSFQDQAQVINQEVSLATG